MIDELIDLLQRQTQAVQALEWRLRSIELLVAAEEQRFLGAALDEAEQASQRLAGLELGRSLALSAAGLPADATAQRVMTTLAGEPSDRALLECVVDDLRTAMMRLADARARTDAAVREAAACSRQRVEAAAAFAAV